MTALANGLAEQEKIVERGLGAFLEVGVALSTIRDQSLYREAGAYPTFEAYCKGRFNLSRSRAYQLIEATEIAGRVSSMPEEDDSKAGVMSTICGQSEPLREGQLRPLAKLPAEEQADAWTEAKEAAAAADKPLTAKQVKAVVARRIEREEGESVEPETLPEAPKGSVDPDSLEAVSRDLSDATKKLKAARDHLKAVLGMDGGKPGRPWCGKISGVGSVVKITQAITHLREQHPVGGEPDAPITMREQKVAEAGAES